MTGYITLNQNKGLYWFHQDLRLTDNSLLNYALQQSDSVAFVYVVNPFWLQPKNFQHSFVGAHNFAFIIESLLDLEQQLAELGYRLHILYGDPVELISKLVSEHEINLLVGSRQVGYYEAAIWRQLKQRLPQVRVKQDWNNYLYVPEEIFDNPVDDNFSAIGKSVLSSFTAFRRHVEQQVQLAQSETIRWHDSVLQPLLLRGDFLAADQLKIMFAKMLQCQHFAHDGATVMFGGELSARVHLASYFSSDLPSTYKHTRNELDGFDNSTKFSAHLAHGNISPRQIWQAVEDYEKSYISNEDTYWIKFELLWREYFHWSACQRGLKLYQFQGNARRRPLTSYFPERFKKWCNGNTPYPIVNACMRQLNTTGFMSNRGRQLVASCLVHELGLDWRYGAAYFQQQLVDHDVASNWGNWQYIAGVGTDPRGGRQFNLAKQAATYDPDSSFITTWQGRVHALPLDSVDAADWPVQPIDMTS